MGKKTNMFLGLLILAILITTVYKFGRWYYGQPVVTQFGGSYEDYSLYEYREKGVLVRSEVKYNLEDTTIISVEKAKISTDGSGYLFYSVPLNGEEKTYYTLDGKVLKDERDGERRYPSVMNLKMDFDANGRIFFQGIVPAPDDRYVPKKVLYYPKCDKHEELMVVTDYYYFTPEGYLLYNEFADEKNAFLCIISGFTKKDPRALKRDVYASAYQRYLVVFDDGAPSVVVEERDDSLWIVPPVGEGVRKIPLFVWRKAKEQGHIIKELDYHIGIIRMANCSF